MIKIALCDDNLTYIDSLAKTLNKIASKNNIDIEITSFYSGESLLEFCTNYNNIFDIYFLDILMDGINGIETAKKLRELSIDSYIIFLTSSKEYALDSYSVNAHTYLLKPYSPQDIEDKFLEISNKIELDNKNIICVKNNQDIYTISLNTVVYFESNLRKITAHMKTGEELTFYKKMNELEDEILDSLFIRCHRSFLVNLLYIKNIVSNDLITTTNEYIPISKKYLNATRDSFTEYIKVKLST